MGVSGAGQQTHCAFELLDASGQSQGLTGANKVGQSGLCALEPGELELEKCALEGPSAE